MQTPPAPPSLLRHRPFALFWFARVASTVAFQAQAVAVGWQIYALTGSPLALGLVGLAQFVPMVLLTLVVGHVADNFDRARIAAICQAVEAAMAGLLAVGSAAGWLGPGAIFAAVAVTGAARAFESPSMAALVPTLVPTPRIPQASAWSAAANQTATILGPAAGGLLYALGPTVPYAVAGGLFLAASMLAVDIRPLIPPPPREKPTLRALFSGIGFIRQRPVILGTLSLDLFAVLLGGATALLPVYARDILHTGPWGLGVLRSAPAAGALGMSVLLAHRPLQRRVGRTMFGAVIVFGLATIVFGLSRSLPLSLAALVLLGAADVVSVVIRFSLVQIRTPDEMRGRVSAVNGLFVGTSNQLGEFESGTAAALLGTVPAVVLGGLGTVLVALLWIRLFPALWGVDTLEAGVSPSPSPSPAPATSPPGPVARPGAAGGAR